MKNCALWLLTAWALCAVGTAQDITEQRPNGAGSYASAYGETVGPLRAWANPGGPPSVEPGLWTIRVQVNEVTVPFSATDHGKVVLDITGQDVKLTEDERPVDSITYFGHLGELPLRLGLLIDSSDSIIQRSDFEEDAASTFLHKVLKPDTDRAFVMHFTTKGLFMQEETGDLHKLDSAIETLNPKGRTAMFDAVYAACKKLGDMRDGTRSAKVLVLVSDGGDNSSRMTLDKVIALAQSSEVVVFVVSTNGSRSFYQKISRTDAIMRKLAEETGGRAFFVDDCRKLGKAFSALNLELRNRYVVSYKPIDLKDDGQYHRIRLLISKTGKALQVLARKGYYSRSVNPMD